MWFCVAKSVSVWDRDDPRVLALNTYSIPPSPVQHLGAWIKVDLTETRAGGEWGFITLIVMPTAHNETHYRADVVRLEWLKRHEQPCRSEEGKKESEKGSPSGKWWKVQELRQNGEIFKMTKGQRKTKKVIVECGTEGMWGKKRKADRKDNKASWGNTCIPASFCKDKNMSLSVIKALTATDSNIAPFYFGLNTTLTGIESSLRCHVECWRMIAPC